MTQDEIPSEKRLNLCGEQVRHMRQKRGWSLLQLKEMLEPYGMVLDRTNLTRLELGRRRVSDGELVVLAHVFEVSLDALLWGDVPPTRSQFKEAMRTALRL